MNIPGVLHDFVQGHTDESAVETGTVVEWQRQKELQIPNS